MSAVVIRSHHHQVGANVDEMNDINQSQDAAELKPRLIRPDILTRVAGSHLSRRDMVKASVVAGGLVWSAPMLLSGNKASAQVADCCGAGSSIITVRIDLDGTVSCGPITCLSPGCDPDIEECLDNFVNVNLAATVDILGLTVSAIGITLQGATLVRAAAETNANFLSILTPGCHMTLECPGLSVVVPPIVIQADGLILVASSNLIAELDHIELEICVPGSATGLCG